MKIFGLTDFSTPFSEKSAMENAMDYWVYENIFNKKNGTPTDDGTYQDWETDPLGEHDPLFTLGNEEAEEDVWDDFWNDDEEEETSYGDIDTEWIHAYVTGLKKAEAEAAAKETEAKPRKVKSVKAVKAKAEEPKEHADESPKEEETTEELVVDEKTLWEKIQAEPSLSKESLLKEADGDIASAYKELGVYLFTVLLYIASTVYIYVRELDDLFFYVLCIIVMFLFIIPFRSAITEAKQAKKNIEDNYRSIAPKRLVDLEWEREHQHKKGSSRGSVIGIIVIALIVWSVPGVTIGLHLSDVYHETHPYSWEKAYYEEEDSSFDEEEDEDYVPTSRSAVSTTVAETTEATTSYSGRYTTRRYTTKRTTENFYGVHDYVDAEDFADEMADEEFDGSWEDAYQYYEDHY